MFKTNFLAFIVVALVISACTSSSNNKQREIDQKVDKLLIQMTLEEKAGQMTQVDVNYLDDPNDIKTYHLGSILSGGNSKPKINSPKGWLEMARDFQARLPILRSKRRWNPNQRRVYESAPKNL